LRGICLFSLPLRNEARARDRRCADAMRPKLRAWPPKTNRFAAFVPAGALQNQAHLKQKSSTRQSLLAALPVSKKTWMEKGVASS
jgi:hypothetical protein